MVPSCKNGPTVAFNPVGAKGDITPENKAEMWRLPPSKTRPTPDVVTPIRVGDMRLLLRRRAVHGGDAKTGKQLYRAELTQGSSTGRNWSRPMGRSTSTPPTVSTDVVRGGQGVQEAGDEHAARHDLRLARHRRRPHLPPRLRLPVGDRDEVIGVCGARADVTAALTRATPPTESSVPGTHREVRCGWSGAAGILSCFLLPFPSFTVGSGSGSSSGPNITRYFTLATERVSFGKQRGPADALAVDARAVRAAEIADEKQSIGLGDHAVQLGDALRFETDIAVLVPAEQGEVLGKVEG